MTEHDSLATRSNDQLEPICVIIQVSNKLLMGKKMDYQQTEVWKRTLAESKKKGETIQQQKSRLREAFIRFRDRAAQLANEIPRDLPHFTVHDVTHLDALWEMVDIVGGPEYPITPCEAFVLGGAILVHDLAMSQAAYQGEWEALKKENVWRDTVASLLRAKLDRIPTEEEINKPDAETEKSATNTLLREFHARQAVVLLTKEWGYNGTKFYLLDDPDLRLAFADDIGKVAHSHHWSVGDLSNPQKLKQKVSPAPAFLPCDWTIDLVKLACLLRCADAAHCDSRRASAFLASLRQPSGYSDQHWAFQSVMRRPHREKDQDRLRYISDKPFRSDMAAAWWVAYDWLRMVDRELRSVDALLADTDRHRLAARGVWNIDDPERLKQDIPTEGWEPVNAEVRISDVSKLVQMLGGKQLYGDRPEIPLRELIQNASDAIRARRKLEARNECFGTIVVRPGYDPATGEDWLEVEDNGIGMSKAVLTGPLLDFGTKFWGTTLMQREFPGLQASGMDATGQFGIGFFSVFMWGSRVQVITRRYDRGQDETWVLEFQYGATGRPLVRQGNREEQLSLREGGTRVRVWCDKTRAVVQRLLRREHPPNSDSTCTWKEVCEWVAPALDTNLNVEVQNQLETAVVANDWLTIDALTMVRRNNHKNHDAIQQLNNLSDIYRDLTPFLDAVRDASGKPIARATAFCLSTNHIHEGNTVCGGLRTGVGGSFLGIRFGATKIATRESAETLPHHNEAWKQWAGHQLRHDDSHNQPEFRALAGSRLLPLTDIGDMPVGKSHKGWVSIPAFMQEVEQQYRFLCVFASLWLADKILAKTSDTPTILVDDHLTLNQIDGRSYSILTILRDAAAKQWGTECKCSDWNSGHRFELIGGDFVFVHTFELTRQRTNKDIS